MAYSVGGGPVPKHSSERRRRNKPEGGITQAARGDGKTAVVDEKHESDPTWHPLARRWFDSLSLSGQARFYEPSDWAVAEYIAHAMTENINNSRGFSAQLMASIMTAMSNLLVTEGDRRRVRMELEKPDASDADEEASVTAMADYQSRFGG